jgi:hypothetical protein
MSILNPNLSLILDLIGDSIPEDIKNKIVVLLLGINCNYARMIKWEIKIKANFYCWHNAYEFKPQTTLMQHKVMCEIRIAEFDADFDAGRRKADVRGGIENIRKYMKFISEMA